MSAVSDTSFLEFTPGRWGRRRPDQTTCLVWSGLVCESRDESVWLVNNNYYQGYVEQLYVLYYMEPTFGRHSVLFCLLPALQIKTLQHPQRPRAVERAHTPTRPSLREALGAPSATAQHRAQRTDMLTRPVSHSASVSPSAALLCRGRRGQAKGWVRQTTIEWFLKFGAAWRRASAKRRQLLLAAMTFARMTSTPPSSCSGSRVSPRKIAASTDAHTGSIA